ncbi:MAG: MerR family transcriptional regulator [Natronospirillum sp.]
MNETLFFSMSETSRRTGVSSPTLRKWAARYDIDAKHRTQGGHRLYSAGDIDRLRRINELKDRGWALTDLAALSPDELARMTPLDTTDEIPGRICFCGPRVTVEFAPWFAARANILDDVDVSMASGVLVWEVGSLSDQHIERAQRLTQAGVPILLVYHYALSRRLQQLQAIGVVTQSGPLDWASLMRWLLAQAPEPMFTDQELRRWASSKPHLVCECPQHLAELLIKLRDFAAYCQQCSLDSPQNADLHHRLYHWTLSAQQPLEAGLSAAIAHEKMNINERAGAIPPIEELDTSHEQAG